MNRRHAKLIALIFLVGISAFVLDVLSPATPTPNAQFVAKLFVIALFSLSVLCWLIVPPFRPITAEIRQQPDSCAGRPRSRLLIALVCILLC
jgi:hypothetical protein